MTIRVALHHRTLYRYDRSITLSPHVLRLRPAAHSRTPVLSYSLKIKPENHFINWQQDPFGNYLARLVFPESTDIFEIDVELVADLSVINPFDFFVEEYAEDFPFSYDVQLKKELAPYLHITDNGPLLQEFLKCVDQKKRHIVYFLVAINELACKTVDYTVRMEPGVQSCEETLKKKSGSCRDSAWMLVQALRHMGLAARFVSGYLVQLSSDEKSLDGPSGPETDFTDLHAWAEVYVPGAGWLGLDPTSGLFAGEGHIPLACAPDPVSAAPVTGKMDQCEVTFEYENRVERIHEDPRVTKPYSDDQWQLINALGEKTDTLMKEMDIRLTMGGEPTFVSIDDMDGAEWTIAALGENKRLLAGNLIRRIRKAFAPDGVLHYGQGKWYPGEPLPRWALGCFWRTDGEPVWKDPSLLAEESQDYKHTIKEAESFFAALVKRLNLSADFILPAYEDPFHAIWQEINLPDNLDPLKADLKDPAERRRLAALLSRGLNTPTGLALPLAAAEKGGWRSSSWPLRRPHLFLLPGDSSMGFRLPLDSLPWVVPEEREEPFAEDTMKETAPLPVFDGEAEDPSTPPQEPTKEPPEAKKVIHTCLCIEPRKGRLHLFLPPLTRLEEALALLAAIEATAAELNMPVVLEGYEPPHDPRLKKLLVTPDPGVIEVNVHPASSWKEQVEITETLYAEARLARLGTEKFMLDGRHTGTSGGNHITLGGPTPADSPMLRRPDLLRSLITYWQHHPGLSYLFSGMFIGPTSQAPRVDEGRNEALYELEIAFREMPDAREGETPSPWLVDRLLRNLLVDVTGNTHRAEFCIDKLYSPDGPTGRLGLVELRAFEMPPHSRMSLTQNLLLRALITWFWKTPYQKPLIRWGTELHDRFMLPHFIHSDINDVCRDLQQAGLPFMSEWLDPFMEFRFPRYGSLILDDIHMTLRMALEPWHVLGEEVSRSGVSRYVDSSMERLEVTVKGMTAGRHVLLCNGRRLPLRATDTHGTHVAGVRYRAWHPASALHPTIKVHTPLVFDLLDSWNGRILGGCTYHVSHPGGRNHETFPVNANEAESRRFARFWDMGHTAGPLEHHPIHAGLGKFSPEGSIDPPKKPLFEEENPEYPRTLDLRRRPGWDIP
ncbi:MAG: transglutaminase family protein [Magnetococcales bacterium]|nr:transglutaminase family protein [Magnetococcales bacterium]